MNCQSRAEFAEGGGSARCALILRRGLAAVVAASLLLVVPAVPAGAENDNPCQVYQDELALQEARLEASPSWPRHYRDQAHQDLQTCLGEDGNGVAVVPAQPSASQVQSYTYSWLNSPYCGWTQSNMNPTRSGDCGRTQEEHDRLVARGAELYRPPIGGGPNGTIRVPCIGGQQVATVHGTRTRQIPTGDRNNPTRTIRVTANFAQVDDDGNFVTTRNPPPPGYSCW